MAGLLAILVSAGFGCSGSPTSEPATSEGPGDPTTGPVDDAPTPLGGEQLLGPFSPNPEESVVRSKDGRHVAWTSSIGMKTQVFLDGRPVGGEYGIVGGLSISPDGRHTAFLTRSDGKWQVVRDGRPGPRYDDLKQVTALQDRSGSWHKLECAAEKRPMTPVAVFSPDGQEMAYAAESGGTWRVHVDDQVGPEFDGIGREGDLGIVFSPDSKRMAYLARKGTKWQVVSDGRRGPKYDEVMFADWGGLLFSPDGKHLAYQAKTADRLVLVLDGQASPWYEALRVSRLESLPVLFSPDSRRTAYAAKTGGKWRIIVEGTASKETYDDVVPGALTFSEDSRHVACGVRKGHVEFMVVDGVPSTNQYIRLGYETLLFSQDGGRFAYEATTSDTYEEPQNAVVVDGQAGPKYSSIQSWSLRFSPNSKRFAYQAQFVGQRRLAYVTVVDGKADPEYGHVDDFLFSPDSKHFAYSANSYPPDESFLVVDGEARPQIGLVHPIAFSPNSAHIACLVRSKKGGKWSVVMDRREGTHYDRVFWPERGFDNDVFSYLAVREKMLYQVRQLP